MTFSTAQFVFDSKLRQSNKNLLDSLKARIINKMFDTYKKQNPIIEYYIGKFKMQLPFSHQLPFIIRLFPHYSTNLARIAKQVKNKYPDMKLIDIGANIGDTVALLRTETMFPILCIEGDEYFFSILQNNATQFSNLYLTKNYVGESSQVVNAVSVELGGTAHLNQTDLINGNAVQLKKLSTILADYQAFSEAKMLKIDTDGFDNKVLRGSLDFLEAVQPIVFFEYDPFFYHSNMKTGFLFLVNLRPLAIRRCWFMKTMEIFC